MNISTHKQISNLQEELAKFKAVKEEMQRYIRELEQKNDNLEQTNRCAMFSLGEFETKMNEALEKNAILQSEMEAKDDLSETVQRLRDETRDLKQELAVRQKANQTSNLKHSLEANTNNLNKMDTAPSYVENPGIKSESSQSNSLQQQAKLNTILNELNLQQQQQQQLQNNKTTLLNGINEMRNKSTNSSASMASQQISGMTASKKISALNFVGDALRKVTVLKEKLFNVKKMKTPKFNYLLIDNSQINS